MEICETRPGQSYELDCSPALICFEADFIENVTLPDKDTSEAETLVSESDATGSGDADPEATDGSKGNKVDVNSQFLSADILASLPGTVDSENPEPGPTETPDLGPTETPAFAPTETLELGPSGGSDGTKVVLDIQPPVAETLVDSKGPDLGPTVLPEVVSPPSDISGSSGSMVAVLRMDMKDLPLSVSQELSTNVGAPIGTSLISTAGPTVGQSADVSPRRFQKPRLPVPSLDAELLFMRLVSAAGDPTALPCEGPECPNGELCFLRDGVAECRRLSCDAASCQDRQSCEEAQGVGYCTSFACKQPRCSAGGLCKPGEIFSTCRSLTCQDIQCQDGEKCQVVGSAPICVRQTCSDVSCRAEEQCVLKEGGPTCTPRTSCQGVACPPGYECRIADGIAACAKSKSITAQTSLFRFYGASARGRRYREKGREVALLIS